VRQKNAADLERNTGSKLVGIPTEAYSHFSEEPLTADSRG
jgi:hypothetical protein